MKKLYLHIGLGKTGSSALQSWLSLNAEALAKQGIDYADTVPEIKYGESLSGNGKLLHEACISLDFVEVEKLITSTYFFSPENKVAIISCELFQGIRPTTVLKIREICESNGIEIRVIAYVRSAYEVLYSTYIQFVKRSSYTHSFGEKDSDTSLSTLVDYLKRYREVYGENLILLNYDEAKKDICASFSAATGINSRGLKKLKQKVNRSLSLQETELLRRVNGLHDGAFSTQISDFVIGLSPDIKTPVYYEEALVQKVRRDTEKDVFWINETFNLTPPLATDYYTGQTSATAKPLDRASYQPVLNWALEYTPSDKQLDDFASFLKEFAACLIEFSDDDALALMRRAQAVQKEIAQRVEEPEDPEEVEVCEPLKPRFLITYLQTYTLPEGEEAEQFYATLFSWTNSIAEYAQGSTINHLENTQQLNSSSLGSAHSQALASGFSILEMDDMDTALAFANACPLLEVGGSLEVSRIVQLPQT